MTKVKGQGKKILQLVSTACSDESFKARLLSDATAVLKENGIAVPEGVTVRAVEDTDKLFHLVIPPKLSRELSDEDLTKEIESGCAGESGGADRRVVRVHFDSWADLTERLRSVWRGTTGLLRHRQPIERKK